MAHSYNKMTMPGDSHDDGGDDDGDGADVEVHLYVMMTATDGKGTSIGGSF